MNKNVRSLLPWVSFGVFFSVAIYVLNISNAVSYLSDDPKTCANCHIMTPQYQTWFHSAHREQATCNDCHVPHDSEFSKYLYKAKDGIRHATLFTLGLERQSIMIEESNKKVVQNNCIRCHSNLFEDSVSSRPNQKAQKLYTHSKERACWDCHKTTPHGTGRSLTSESYPYIGISKSQKVPVWLKQAMKESNKKDGSK